MRRGATAAASDDVLQRGQAALARGAWEESRAAFQAALTVADSAEALEGHGMAAWWLDDVTATLESRGRAYRLYRKRGDRRGAARIATALALDYSAFRGEQAVARGWLQRARSLLDGLDPAPEHGWLAIWEGLWSLPDTTTARRLAAEAVQLGRSLGVLDIEMAGLALEGLALLSEGDVTEGMPRLDEATAAAIAGELSDLAIIGLVCCFLIYGCELVRDYDRAAQWCGRVQEFSQRWNIRHLFAVCRTHYSGVLVWRGAWAEAEAELLSATDELANTRNALAVEGIVRLAELRRRQGRLDEAATLFARSEFHPLAHQGRAELALDRGDPAAALALAERFLRHLPAVNRPERAVGFELVARAAAALGDQGRAAASAAELRLIADAVGTEPLRAAASFAEGVVAAAGGDHETGRRHFEDAIDLDVSSGAPFEAALAQIELARSLVALSRRAAAEPEARHALGSLERMGAVRQAQRAAALLREIELENYANRAEVPGLGGLTPREQEVLQLVAQGLSNSEIAAQLVLSPHTVHRHLSNIFGKLDLTSRAAAVAYGARHGLL